MFYHAAFLFDYVGFEKEARVLACAVEQGDLIPLHRRVSEIVTHSSPERLPGNGNFLKLPQSISEVEASPYISSEIGRWFMVVVSTYLRPCPVSIGYNWGNLSSALEALGWKSADIERLCHGMPMGLLVTSAADSQHSDIVTHSDPYWRWIRLPHTYNQGGWLSVEGSRHLYVLLQEVEPQIAGLRYKGALKLTSAQNENWRSSVQRGCRDALMMLSAAIEANTGLYMVVLWEWDD